MLEDGGGSDSGGGRDDEPLSIVTPPHIQASLQHLKPTYTNAEQGLVVHPIQGSGDPR